MRIDFSGVQDAESFISVPEGVYVCRIAEVREGITRDGNPRWAMRLEVADGDYAGRTAGWDGLVWSERGLPRIKKILARLGYDVSGTIDLEPEDLEGSRIKVLFQVEHREDPISGTRVSRLRVPYLGYESVAEEATTL